MKYKIEIINIKSFGSNLDLLEKEDQGLEVTEFDRQGLAFLVAKNHFVVGNLVTIFCQIYLDKQIFPFEATAAIQAKDEVPAASLFRIKMQLRQFDREIWKRFLDTADAKQKHIDGLLAKMKGDS